MLEHKVIAITGGSGLIGQALAKGFVQAGAFVIVGDIKEHQFVNEISEKDSIKYIKLDVTCPESLKEFIKNSSNQFKKIDTIIHSAYPRSKGWGSKLEDLDCKHLKEDLYNQLGSAIMLSQKSLEYFRLQGHGNLIHISSIQGIAAPKFEHYEETGMCSPIEYTAIKAGINAMVKYLAKYCKNQNIRVNSICPGGVFDDQPKEFLNKYRGSCLNKGMLDPEDLVGTALYLASESAKYVNGQNIVVDDGWCL